MRVLFASTQGAGHFNPLVPFIDAALRQGHEVLVAGPSALAPTTELRQLQYREDDRLGVGKRSRAELAAGFRQRYLREVLGQVDLRPVVEAMPVDGAAALMCVEADPEACHRSLVAERLKAGFGVPVEHLRPAR